MCFVFLNKDSAQTCKEFACSSDRKDDAASADEVSIRAFDFRFRVFATVFPAARTKTIIGFWRDSGTAVSTRFAEDCLKHIDQLKEVPLESDPSGLPTTIAYEILKGRIAELLERAPSSQHSVKVSPDDVYLFQTGMSSIYLTHLYLSATRPGTTILYGFAFHSTPHIFEKYGANTSHFEWFGRGADLELEALESFAEAELAAGRQIQALWAEFPTNPNLTTPSLKRLRTIADRYSFPVIIDDTVATFINVDLLGDAGTDLLTTSLTKSFSGYADVMGGSIVLNPASKHYPLLKDTFAKHYTNDLYFADAEILEKNSRDFLQRTTILNRNAQALASYLSSPVFAHQVEQIHYPTTLPTSKTNYDANLRSPSEEFPNPGYGCLLSIEFKALEQAIAFFENIPLHCGPHLGAHRTLVLPYPRLLMALGKTDDVTVKKGGMNERYIRVSVGLEDEQDLIERFQQAMLKADEIVKRKGANRDVVEEAACIAASTLT